MNEKIKELAKKAADESNLPESFWWVTQDPKMAKVAEKFAELLVKECLKVVKDNTYGPCGPYDPSYDDRNAAADDRAETIYDDIKSRFDIMDK
jgi:hypothetical protein